MLARFTTLCGCERYLHIPRRLPMCSLMISAPISLKDGQENASYTPPAFKRDFEYYGKTGDGILLYTEIMTCQPMTK